MYKSTLAALFVLLLSWSSLTAAQPFPRPPELESAVSFWRDVFAHYSEHEVVIHDRENLTIVYKVLDFSEVAPLLTREEFWLHRRQVENQVKDELKASLLMLADNLQASQLSPELERLRNLFKVKGLLDREHIELAAENLRGQSGLRERTMEALKTSGRYLPYMEKVFDEMGLPTLLTRLPLVESSFNRKAYSKSGAAGVWQFMPGSARVYMNYDEVGDERRDPWISTLAAAKHLRDDIDMLQRWPLAVTAYNFGRNGIARALAEIEGESLVEMIQRYEHPRWGFAGKNFYAEFLAAVDVEQNALQYFGPLRRDEPIPVADIKVDHYVEYATLRALSGESEERFDYFNPSYSEAVRRGDLYVPPGRTVRVPAHKANAFRQAYASLGRGSLFSEQKSYYVTHRVRRGDTVSGLASRYGSSVREILSANNLRSANRIRIGQNLRIPPRNGRRATPTVHVVRSGETLGEIAAKYGVRTASLQRQNNIAKPHLIRVGQRLQIQGGREPTVYHRVRSGETLAGIARRYKVSVGSLQRNNGIRRPEALQVGARLKVKGGQVPLATYHVIRSGQTLETIARQYGVSVRDIAMTNKLDNVNQIRAGQRLRLPGG